MEMQFKNEIKKLADVVEWFDDWIEEMKLDLTEEELSADETINELETIKKVILDAMERHTVYTSALNKDIVDKDSKIDLLEKEIEGRKEGYHALKDKVDDLEETLEIRTKENRSLIKANEKLKKEYEEIVKSRDTWFETAGEHAETIRRDSEKINKLKDEIVRLNKCIMNKNESINTGNEAIINLRKEIGAHEEENKKLTEKIMELKRTIEKCKDYDNSLMDSLKINNEDLKNQVEYLKKELNKTCTCKELDLKGHQSREMALVNTLADKNDEIKNLKNEYNFIKSQREIDYVHVSKYNNMCQAITLRDEEIKNLREELDKLNARIRELEEELTRAWKNKYTGLNKDWKEVYEAQSISLAEVRKCNDELVDTLNKSSDRIDELEEELDHWKNQERIRTDQLRATESKVDQLYKELEGYKDRDEKAKDMLNDNSKEIKELKDENSYLKKVSKDKNDIIRKAYARYVDEACKGREEIMNECYEKLTKDETGYTGFKQYTLRALEAQEGNEKEAKKFICDTADIIFYNKRAEEKRKEETKKELNEAFGVPCGEDSIE